MTISKLQLTKNMKTKTQTNFNPQKYECIENKRWFTIYKLEQPSSVLNSFTCPIHTLLIPTILKPYNGR